METKNNIQGASENHGISKKEQVEFLEGKLNESIKLYLENEVNNRMFMAKTLLNNGLSKEMEAAKKQVSLSKEALEGKIRNYRGLISEIENNTFNV